MARRNKDVDPEKSKRARGARSKGSRAQRDIAKLLGLWFFSDSHAFHSTPASGGLRWKSDVAKTRGDIVAFLNALTGEFPEQQLPQLPATPGKTFN